LSDELSIHSGIKRGDALTPLYNFTSECVIGEVREDYEWEGINLNETSVSGLCRRTGRENKYHREFK
jgi:hypothetical protein